MKRFAVILCVVVLANMVEAQKTRSIAFYNVENLFDTLDGPNDDAEFLPSAKNEWNNAKGRGREIGTLLGSIVL